MRGAVSGTTKSKMLIHQRKKLSNLKKQSLSSQQEEGSFTQKNMSKRKTETFPTEDCN